jgi:hypothetical protein
MRLAAPAFAQIDPRCFEDAGSMGLVAARVVVRRGELANHGFDPMQTARYKFADTLGGGTAPRPFSNKASVEVRGVTSVKLVARDMDDLLPKDEMDLTSADNDWVEITIANADDGRLPERLPDPNPPRQPTEDEDYRWFYSLCAKRGGLDAARNGASLPIPVRQGATGPGVVVCMNATFDR